MGPEMCLTAGVGRPEVATVVVGSCGTTSSSFYINTVGQFNRIACGPALAYTGPAVRPGHARAIRQNHTSLKEIMKFAYTIIYVPDVAASLDFYTRAFGFERGFFHESGMYGELQTGETTLSFASHAMGEMNFPAGHVAAHSSARPLGMEVGFVTPDVAAAHARALAAGATELSAPEEKPWGQTVSYVRCPDGSLVELCSPMGGEA